MSVEALCQGDEVIRQVATTTRGSLGGQARGWTDVGTALDCLVQTPGAGESRKYDARGQRFSHQVFFAEDPALSVNHRLKWTVRAEATLAVPIYLRVLDCYPEGRPGEDFLWIADCEVETMRTEA
jgi:hypothetical protein